MKKILIIQGHPKKDSFVAALSQHYYDGAKANGHEVEIVHLIDLEFDLILRNGYYGEQELEADLLMMRQKITECNHLVIAYPMWWGTMPALLKGFFDRTFLPGFAFKHTDKFPIKLLKGRSARFIMTMDSPGWFYKLFVGAPGIKMMKNSILKFCGFSPIKSSIITSVRTSDEIKKANWLKKMSTLGAKGI